MRKVIPRAVIALGLLVLASSVNAQVRTGNQAVHVICDDGCAAPPPGVIMDVNLTQILGAAISSLNPLPAELTNTTVAKALAVRCVNAIGTLFESCAGAGGGGSVGQQTMANSSPVVIASDQSTVNVSLTTAIPAGTNNIGDVDILSIPNVTLNALPAGNNNIGDVDILSVIPGAGATNLGKAEDALHTSGDIGVMSLCVRRTSPTDLSVGNTDNDYEPCQVDGNGAQYVTMPSGVAVTSSTLPTGASTLAEQQTQTTALQLIDNIVSGAGANITQLGGTNVSMNTGIRDAGTQRITIATNDVVPVTGTFWQATQPVSFGALPAGTNNIGDVDVLTLPALPTGTNNIGDVDVLTLPAIAITNTGFNVTGSLPAGTNNIGDVDVLSLPANASVNIAQVNGITTSTGVGAAGTGVQRTNDTASGTTGVAIPAQASYQAGVGGGGLLAGVTVCDSQAFLDMTTATTTEIVALTASQKIYVCYWLVESNGTAVVTFKRGTGTNCGTGTTSISPAWDLAAQVGFSGGTGFGAIFDNQVAANALCVTSSAAVNVHVFIRYAKY